MKNNLRLCRLRFYWSPIMKPYRWIESAIRIKTQFDYAYRKLDWEFENTEEGRWGEIPILPEDLASKYNLPPNGELNTLIEYFRLKLKKDEKERTTKKD